MKQFQELKEKQHEIFVELSGLLLSLSSPVRLKIIHLLTQSPQSVETIAEKLNQTTANTSMHLRKMYQEGVVKVTTNKQQRIYSLAHPALLKFWENLQDFAQEQNPTLKLRSEDIYGEDFSWDKTPAETRKLIKENKVILLDVRPDDEVSDEETDAIHLSHSALKNRSIKLPKSKDILVFCRGRFCALAVDAVSMLRGKGYKAYRLEESWYQIEKQYGIRLGA
jgi:rhodanese-related sulfurtransferase/DNA-binding MarR family transcriptional regulator